jgi:hypothetical protein
VIRRLGRILVYLWVLPTSAVGLPFALLALVSGGTCHVVHGVLEVHGGLAGWLLRVCSSLFLRGGASAITFGHVVVARTSQLLDATRAHERVHVRQCERWGPLFIPVYLLACVLAMLQGKRPYMDNVFEREAYGHGS